MKYVLVFCFSFFTIFSFLYTPDISLAYEKNTLFFYGGGKTGYVHTFLDTASITTPTTRFTSSANASGTTIGMMFGVGYAFNSHVGIRSEIEYMYSPPTHIKTSLYTKSELVTQNYSFLLNAYVDYYLTKKIHLYAGAGLGLGLTMPELRNEPNLYYKLDTKASFAYQAGVGFITIWTDDIFTDIGVRYMGYTKYDAKIPATQHIANFSLSTIQVLATIGYRF